MIGSLQSSLLLAASVSYGLGLLLGFFLGRKLSLWLGIASMIALFLFIDMVLIDRMLRFFVNGGTSPADAVTMMVQASSYAPSYVTGFLGVFIGHSTR